MFLNNQLLPIILCWQVFLGHSRAELDDADLYPIIISTDSDKAVFIVPDKGCFVLEEVSRYGRRLNLNQSHVYKTDAPTINSVIDLCEAYKENKINGTEFVVGLQEKTFFIYPGTHYCGAGNNAANYSDLGYYRETDKCCREHDSCMDYVPGWSCHKSIPELCNYTPFTRSHCNCDQKFRNCLLKANETASHHIGLLFFTVFGLKCFREDFPIVGCEQYGGFLSLHCQKYNLDKSGRKLFQFFDSPKFVQSIEQQCAYSKITSR